jgi:hypothetical protein
MFSRFRRRGVRGSPLALVALIAPFGLAAAEGSWPLPGIVASAERSTDGLVPKFICSSLNLEITCTGVNDLGSNCIADRDTTAAGEEAYELIAIDGAGNLIYSFSGFIPVGSSFSIGSFSWTNPPLFNPIRLRFISLAGNGLPEQVVLDILGNCPGLPIGPLGLPPPRPVDAFGWHALALLLGLLVLSALVAVRKR